MKQKFRKLTFVHVCKELPRCMSHFESDFDAIVEGTDSQLFGGTDINSYSLYKLNKEGNKITNNPAWYDEEHLTALEIQDRRKAKELIEEYNLGGK